MLREAARGREPSRKDTGTLRPDASFGCARDTLQVRTAGARRPARRTLRMCARHPAGPQAEARRPAPRILRMCTRHPAGAHRGGETACPTHPTDVRSTPCGPASGGETASELGIPKEHRDGAGTVCGAAQVPGGTRRQVSSRSSRARERSPGGVAGASWCTSRDSLRDAARCFAIPQGCYAISTLWGIVPFAVKQERSDCSPGLRTAESLARCRPAFPKPKSLFTCLWMLRPRRLGCRAMNGPRRQA